jgi:hypothetical protein
MMRAPKKIHLGLSLITGGRRHWRFSARGTVECSAFTISGFELRGNNLKGSKDFFLKVKARIWP